MYVLGTKLISLQILFEKWNESVLMLFNYMYSLCVACWDNILKTIGVNILKTIGDNIFVICDKWNMFWLWWLDYDVINFVQLFCWTNIIDAWAIYHVLFYINNLKLHKCTCTYG